MNNKEIILHGSFLSIFGTGVLITGEPGIGKSELALSLLFRHHQFIADDAPLFSINQDKIVGRNPLPPLPYIAIRGIGLIDIHSLLGPTYIKQEGILELIIDLQEKMSDTLSHLEGETSTKDVLGCLIPSVTIPIIKPRSLEVLVETIVKTYLLKKNKGINPVGNFNELLLSTMSNNS